jgi:hypothetical protein
MSVRIKTRLERPRNALIQQDVHLS